MDRFCEFSIVEDALVFFCSVCISVLVTALICAPKRDCFFLRWSPAVRVLALVAAPTLLIVWPILLYGWFLRSRGVDPADPDFLDD
jgi:hypothetical protein